MTDDGRLDEWLAPDRLSGREREEVLDRVLDRVAPKRAHRFGRWVFGPLTLAAGVVAVVGVAVSRRHAGEFVPRGAAGAGAHVEVVCAGARLDGCPHGSHLLFAASGGGQRGYLAAYAEPAGGGERIWYFSSEHETPEIAPESTPSVPTERAVIVGSEHVAGAYSLHVVVGSHPLSRAQALGLEPGAIVTSEVVRLTVLP